MMKSQNLLLSLLFTLTTITSDHYLRSSSSVVVVQASWCKPSVGNIARLFTYNYCRCLYDDHNGWIVYDVDLLFNQQPQQPQMKLTVKSNNNVSSISLHTEKNRSNNTIIIYDEIFEANSTYDGKTSKCVVRQHLRNNGIIFNKVYCPFDVKKNQLDRHEMTLIVTRHRRRLIYNRSNNKQRDVDFNNTSDSWRADFNNTRKKLNVSFEISSDNSNIKNNEEYISSIITTTTRKWAKYKLPSAVWSCNCNVSHTLSYEALEWNSIRIKWKFKSAASNYLGWLTGLTTKVIFKQQQHFVSKHVHEENVYSEGGAVNNIQSKEVCSEQNNLSTNSCNVHDIAEFVDVWRKFSICVQTTIASCEKNSRRKETCQDVSLTPDTIFEYFKLSDSTTQCDHNAEGKIRVTWSTEHPTELKPMGLVYRIGFYDSHNILVASRDVNNTDATEYIFNHASDITSARVNLCIGRLHRRAGTPNQCSNPKFLRCSTMKRENTNRWSIGLSIGLPLITLGCIIVSVTLCIRKRKNRLHDNNNVVLGRRTTNIGNVVDICVITNNYNNPSIDPQYEQVMCEFGNDEQDFDRLDLADKMETQ